MKEKYDKFMDSVNRASQTPYGKVIKVGVYIIVPGSLGFYFGARGYGVVKGVIEKRRGDREDNGEVGGLEKDVDE
jgi:hypothetical protein